MTPQFLAVLSAFAFACFTISARLGLNHSTPLTASVAAMGVRTLTLWAALFLTRGLPGAHFVAVLLFGLLGLVQTITSLLTFVGLHKIGASRSEPLRNSFPLWSAIIAITILGEKANLAILLGTILIVAGVILLSWRPATPSATYRWWHVLFSLSAAFLAGVAFPVRRYALTISNEPIYLAAVLASVSFTCLVVFLLLPVSRPALIWNRKALLRFGAAGVFEASGAVLALFALSSGPVVVVAPIVATTPLWTMILTIAVLRGLEQVGTRTVVGTILVVAGTVAVTLGR
ncbi:MAG: DMT family transporter [Deltaproteobacteria bacterium]|nr:DMT family transporter [Deltaproteobacteria bacterium]